MFGRIVFVLLLQIAVNAAAEPRQVQVDAPRFVGSAGCKSSSCHGGAGEKRSQYFTWVRKDFHTRAFAILTDARSQRIGAALGISATTSNRCTICHAPMQAMASARLTSGVDPHESVSCENCHGAAEPWLRGHTRTDWAYAARVGAGLRDLKNFYVRANTCVACHQNLDADITAAGHPELVFELDRQSIDEPKHWRDPENSDARMWLVGQNVALRELSWKLDRDKTEPTLSQFQALDWLLGDSKRENSFETSDVDFAVVQRNADETARRAAQQTMSTDSARSLTSGLASLQLPANTSLESKFRCAQRLFFALQALERNDPNLAPPLTALGETVRSPSEFEPDVFSARLADFRRSLTSR